MRGCASNRIRVREEAMPRVFWIGWVGMKFVVQLVFVFVFVFARQSLVLLRDNYNRVEA